MIYGLQFSVDVTNGSRAGFKMSTNLDQNHSVTCAGVPVRRPHFHLERDELFFLVSARPYLKLTDDEIRCWIEIDGSKTISELEILVPGAKAVVSKLWSQNVIEVIDVRPRANRLRVVVVEPHMDDAILSVGGVMKRDHGEKQFTVVSMVGTSNFTSYGKIGRPYFDVNTVSMLRKQESALVMDCLGGKHITLDMLDAPLRCVAGNWTLQQHLDRRRQVSAFINSAPRQEEQMRWTSALASFLSQNEFDEYWFPLGIGASTDHEMTRNASLKWIEDNNGILSRARVCFYRDVPYLSDYPAHLRQLRKSFENSGMKIVDELIPIDAQMQEKLRLISVFASQFKLSYMGPRVKKAAASERCAKVQFSEVLWDIKKVGDKIDSTATYSGRDSLKIIYSQWVRWQKEVSRLSKVNVVCPMGIARWGEDFTLFLNRMPSVKINVYVPEGVGEEVSNYSHERVGITLMPADKKAWVKLILKSRFTHSTGLLLFIGSKNLRLRSLIKLYFFAMPTLVASTFDHLGRVIEKTKYNER